MSPNLLEPALRDMERRAAVAVIRANPEWTLEQLIEQMGASVHFQWLLEVLTIADLRDDHPPPSRAEVDDRVLASLAGAADWGVPVSTVCAYTGLRRDKAWRALRRLIASGRVSSSGTTCATRYRLVAQ